MIAFAPILMMAASSWAEPPSRKIDPPFPNTAFALPLVKGIKMDWALVDKQNTAPENPLMRFDVDPQGNPWFGDGAQKIMVSPSLNANWTTPGRFDDFTFLDEGSHIVCTDKYLATPFFAKADASQEDAAPVLKLRALLPLDHGDCRLFSGGARILYLVTHDDRTNLDGVSTIESGGGSAPKAINLMSSDRRITALAGDGDKTYFADGPWIFELLPGQTRPRRYYTPNETVTGLAYSPKTGLFYATTAHVGFVSPHFQINFLTTPDPQIVLRRNTLFIRLSRTMTVMAIIGADKFKTLTWNKPQKEEKDAQTAP